MLRPAVTACVGVILAARFASSALPAAPDRQTPGVTVSIFNVAHVPPRTLAHAEQVASGIFQAAGIDTEWTAALVANPVDLLTDFSVAPASGCDQPLGSDTVRVQILTAAPPGFSIQALGYSLPCAGRGIQVTIYEDRIEAVSEHTLAAFYRVLGHALAHEIGHVLLQSSAHEKTGIMKSVWSKADWQRAAVTIVPFSSDEANRILQQLQQMRSAGIAIAFQKTPRNVRAAH